MLHCDQVEQQNVFVSRDVLFAHKNGKGRLVVDSVRFVVCICVSDHISRLLVHVFRSAHA